MSDADTPVRHEDAPRPSLLCVLFRAGAEHYALPALDVQKVIEPVPLSRLPRLPQPILGICHHRGRILTVVHLPRLLEEGAEPVASTASRILVLERANRNLGLWVDGVAAIDRVTRPESPGGLLRSAKHNERWVHLFDSDRLVERIVELTKESGRTT